MIKFKLALSVIVLSISNLVFSQVAPQDFSTHPRQYITRNSFWTETVINQKLKGKFALQVDYQYRRMSQAADEKDANTKNIFALPFQQVVRPWIHYNLNPNVRFSLSPAGYWATWNSPTSDAAGKKVKTFYPEIRICPQITLIQNIGRVIFNQRYRYEFRYIGTTTVVPGDLSDFSYGNVVPNTNKKGRLRYFVRAIIPITHRTLENKTVYVNAFNEIFIGTQHNTANNKIFDQNRSFVGLGYKFNDHMKVESGYLLQEVFRYNNARYSKNNVERNNVWQIYLIFDNIGGFFKKPKDTEEKK